MSESRQVIGVTLLLAGPRELDEAAVRSAAEFAFHNAPEKPKVVSFPNQPAFGLQLGPMRIAVIKANRPYFKDVAKVANQTADVAGRIAVQRHAAWLSVDLVGTTPLADDVVLGVLGQMAAEFCEERVLGLMRLPRGPIVGYDISFVPMLRNRNAAKVFASGTPDRIIKARAGNPALSAATAEAQRRWPEFVAAFEVRMAGEGFAIKRKFEVDGRVEHMWISVSSIENDRVHGQLGNTPNILRSMKLGDRVSATVSEVEDWMYMSGKEQVGGFQAKVLKP